MEHRPVQPPPTPVRTFLDELMHSGIDSLNRERIRELSQRFKKLTIDLGNGTLGLGDLYADSCRNSSPIQPAKHRQLILAVPNQALCISGSERTPATQQENGLEQRRLARAIATRDEITARVKRELGSLEASDILHHQLNQAHPFQRRIGMTTYRVSVVFGARTRQLLLESVRPSSTVSVSIAAKASSR